MATRITISIADAVFWEIERLRAKDMFGEIERLRAKNLSRSEFVEELIRTALIQKKGDTNEQHKHDV